MIGKKTNETHIRVLKSDKERFKRYCKKRGLTSSEAFRRLIKRRGLF